MEHELLRGKRILIVEDDAPCRLLLEVLLEDLGCSFEVAANGREAVEKAQQGDYHAVLMDVRMPILKGYDAAMEIRKTNKALPIIAVTAHVVDGVERRCHDCGMNDYLKKPFTQEQLVAMLLKWL